MRLVQEDKQAIIDMFSLFFGPNDHLWLFGSRVDDAKKGGDIDLYIQTHLTADQEYQAKSDYVVALWDKIGEQKIDVVIHLVDKDFFLPIYKVAQEEGVQLV